MILNLDTSAAPVRADVFFFYDQELVAGATIAKHGEPKKLGILLEYALGGRWNFQFVNGILPGMCSPEQFNGIGDLAAFVVYAIKEDLMDYENESHCFIGGISLTNQYPSRPEEFRPWTYVLRQVPGVAQTGLGGEPLPAAFALESTFELQVYRGIELVYQGDGKDLDMYTLATATALGVMQGEASAEVSKMFKHVRTQAQS